MRPRGAWRGRFQPCVGGMRRPVASQGRVPDARNRRRPPGDTSGQRAGRTEKTVMDAVVNPWPKAGLSDHVRAAPEPVHPRPSREDAEAAVRTLIAFAGDNPEREG